MGPACKCLFALFFQFLKHLVYALRIVASILEPKIDILRDCNHKVDMLEKKIRAIKAHERYLLNGAEKI